MRSKNENLYNSQVFANNLKAYMEMKGVTQKEVADAIGISQGAICDWMRLRNYPRMDRIQRLAEYFGCEKSDLVEERSTESKYFFIQDVKRLEKLMLESKETLDFHLAIEELSPENKELVKSLVYNLKKGEAK